MTTIRQRLDLIARRIELSVTRPQKTLDGRHYMIRDLAHFIIRGTPQHGPASEMQPIEAIFRYVKNNIEYRQDPVDYDYYASAGRTINSGAGDCDDHVIVLNSLLNSVGYTTGARVISPDGSAWHIYSLVGVDPAFNGAPSQFIALDTSYGDEVGWEPADKYRKHEIECLIVKGRVTNYRVVRRGGGLFSFLRAAGL